MARSHKAIVRLARSHQTVDELVAGISIFDTAWWRREKQRIAKRVAKTELRRQKVKS